MRIYKPGTDQSLTLTLHADHKPCAEFALPPSHPNAPLLSPDVCELFVPVEDNATLTLTGAFAGTVLNFRLDVLADGAFVVDRCVEGNKDGSVKFWENRKLEVRSFLHVPEPAVAGRGRKAKVVEGALVAKRLSPSDIRSRRFREGYEDEGTQLGVGSLAVLVSLNKEAWETRGDDSVPAYPSNTLGSWRDMPSSEVRDFGIEPEHELHMDVFPDADPVREKKANAFWRSYTSSRFGVGGPWATVVFYYRSKQAIENAGCVPFKGTFDLSPHEGHFQAAGAQPEIKQEKKSLGIGRPLVLPPSFSAAPSMSIRRREDEDDEDDFESLMGRYHRSINQPDPATPTPGRRDAFSAQGSLLPAPTPDTVGATGLEFLDIEPSAGGYEISFDDDDGDLFMPPADPPTPETLTPVIKVEPLARPAPTTPSKRLASPAPTTPASAKRFASPSSTTSTSGSPAKRARTATPSADFSARKAALLASISAKKERKAAAQAKLEAEMAEREQQRREWEAEEARRVEEARLREEEEEARLREEEERLREQEEEEELARLEREAEEEDEELEFLEGEAERGRVEWEAEMMGKRL